MSIVEEAVLDPHVLPGVWFIPRVDRLAVRDGRGARDVLQSPPREVSAPAERRDDVSPVLERLRAHGLFASVSKRAGLLILGGTGIQGDPEAPLFEGGFMISREPDGTFLVLVTGPGPLEELAHATDLAESAEKVLAIYRARQDASGESRPPRAR